MSAQVWYIIGIVGFSLSAVALAAAIIIFIKLDILSVIGDLTGRTVAREVQAIRESNASGGDILHRPSRVNLERGKLTKKASSVFGRSGAFAPFSRLSNRLDNADRNEIVKSTDFTPADSYSDRSTIPPDTGGGFTEKISGNVSEIDTAGLMRADDRDSKITLEKGSAQSGTSVLGAGNDARATLSGDNTGTTVLGGVTGQLEEVVQAVPFKIVRSVTEIHTDESI